ncbi:MULTISPECIES: binary toxin-like calcium binding domain-containing protein [Haloarcula]|uniref:Binary toxin-like calcium binding domain-containing protein n=2 Tax=Haloarcula sebkhae TaxID=932660 RepID=A0ACC6VSG1_9EURY|nr:MULTISPECIES: binary toxin-like calcium binding domain-containing protein [Haloarcula]GGK78645.1 hypothetical protein GCM10009067_33750 [Haloarcula sebkhae]
MRKVRIVLLLVSIMSAGCAGVLQEDATEPADNVEQSASETPPPQTERTAIQTATTEDPANVDSDGDGLSNAREQELSTDLNYSDTDGDGLLDAAEVNTHGTDPTLADTDKDGLSDSAEVNTHGTDPTLADTDQDGLSDSAEINTHGTDPMSADTDEDGLFDGTEINTHGTDPQANDTDGDGLSDSAEINEYRTDPTLVDTDGDGLSDNAEINTHGTNPRANDTDGDGLDDGRELDLATDVLDSDTDDDGLPDGAEVDMTDRFPGANPVQKDIFVEVDYKSRLSRNVIRDINEEFERAPVTNPDGTSGINIHLYQDDNLRCEDASGYIRDQIQYGCKSGGETVTSPDNAGYYYIQIVSTVQRPGNAMSNGGLTVGSVAFVELSSDEITGHLFMHELGHLLNIRDPGVDSRQRGYSEYRSVMNYLSPGESIGYARSDWADINQSVQRVPGTTKRAIINQSDERE